MSADPSSAAIRRAAASTVYSLFLARARVQPAAPAIVADGRTLDYGTLLARVDRLAAWLAAAGVRRGERVAVLSENRLEYPELALACARLGAILACQNWRLAAPELRHCIQLVEPRAVLVSPRHEALLAKAGIGAVRTLRLGEDYERALAGAPPAGPAPEVDPEDGLLILYTSGTTGLPKGAVISHRAEIARAIHYFAEFHIPTGETALTWCPYFHMAAMEPALATLMSGGKVIVVDGFRVGDLADAVAAERIGHLLLMPGMIQSMIDELHRRQAEPAGIRLCGAMADLVPLQQIAEVTRLLGAPFLNSFGATETGFPPGSRGLLAVGEVPDGLAKLQATFCEVRLVDADDNDVPDGTPGEAAVRGPLLFSGYWNAPETNAKDFRGGWFHMGDMFVRRPDGKLDFVDRVKYLIKSGGENIYPAEIERVLLAHPDVADAIVVRRRDARWGEVPVAVIAAKRPDLDVAELAQRCRAELAGYKQPKDYRFIDLDALPRSTTGKIQRHEVERWLETQGG